MAGETEPIRQPMTRDRLAARLGRRLRGPAAERVVAAILADVDRYAAHMIETHAHPAYPPRLAAVLGVDQERQQGEQDAAGGER